MPIKVDSATRVQILNEAVYISHYANTLGKGMSRTIPSFNQGMATGREERKRISNHL